MHTDAMIGRMRVCPRCQSRYDDDALSVCPRDGSPLVESPQRDLLDEVAALMSGEHTTRTGRPKAGNAREQPPAQQIGLVLGSYRLLDLLGQGGMGWVYRAEHVKLGRHVALKLLRADRSGRRDAVARFFHEARLVNRVRHRNIVDITDLVELDSGITFIIMELLVGLTLGAWQRDNPGETERALDLAVQICDGLAAAHRLGVVHRDLKPDNIMVVPTDEGEQVKLLDFGIAKLLSDDELGPDTGAGTLMGTPAYMSPEQAGGLPVDARSDIYSLGAILYEMFARERVFRGKSLGEYVRKHLNETPRPPSQTAHGGDIDPRLEEIILRCLAKKPDERYAGVDALRDELAALRSSASGMEARVPELMALQLSDRVFCSVEEPIPELAALHRFDRAASAAERCSGVIYLEAPGATKPKPAIHRYSTLEGTRISGLVAMSAVRRVLPWALAAAVALLGYRVWSATSQPALPGAGAPAMVAAPPNASTQAVHVPAPAIVHLDSMPSAEVRLVGHDSLQCRTPCTLTVSSDAPRSALAFHEPGHLPAQVPFDPRDPAQVVYVKLGQAPDAKQTKAPEHSRTRSPKRSRRHSVAQPAGSPAREVRATETLDPFGMK